MANFSNADKAALEAAIKFLVGAQAYELPFSEDLALRLAKVSDSTGFLSQGAFLEAVKLNPLSTLLRWMDSSAGGGGTCSEQTGSGAPASTPDFVGQLYHDTTADTYWRSTGLTSADWTAISGGASTALVILAAGLGELSLFTDSVTTTVACPNATSIDNAGGFYLSDFAALISVSFPLLASISTAGLEIDDDLSANPLLASISAPGLVTIIGNVSCGNNPSLTTIDWSSWLPTDGTTITFAGCALTAASVELILSRCVASSVTICTIDLSGGTNAGLTSLSTQGQTDYAALVVAGNTMTLNP